jgi:hypothetical protein
MPTPPSKHNFLAATSTQADVIEWHIKAGAANRRLAGHALRLLHECVEVCLAAGASGQEITDATLSELRKAVAQGTSLEGFLPERSISAAVRAAVSAAVRDELADVSIVLDTVAFWASGSPNLEPERAAKIAELWKRSWTQDTDGVLWQPGKVPAYRKPFLDPKVRPDPGSAS